MKSKKFLINLLEKSNFSEILKYQNAVSQFRQSPLDQIEEYEKIYLRYMESAKLIEQLRR